MIGSMLFFWYAMFPMLTNESNWLDALYFFGIPISGFICLVYVRIKDVKVIE